MKRETQLLKCMDLQKVLTFFLSTWGYIKQKAILFSKLCNIQLHINLTLITTVLAAKL